jgi:hypothetical protein
MFTQPIHKKYHATSFSFYFLSTFGKSKSTHLTTDVMFSGQRFAILLMFCHGEPTDQYTKQQTDN